MRGPGRSFTILPATFQKRLRKEKRSRKRLQEQLDLELSRRAQLEEALRNGGGSEQMDLINEKLQHQNNHQQPKPPTPNLQSPLRPQSHHPPSTPEIPERHQERIKQEVEEPPQQQYVTPRDMRDQMREPPPPPPLVQENKLWGYTGLDLINSGAAFWQNYSESLAQELDMERKSRQQQPERDLKSPLQNRSDYYKNSVMFTGAAT